MDKAIFAAGCFWGVESLFKELDGVISTKVGYTGGVADEPTYKEVCEKETGHAEAIEIVFDSAVVGYEVLLDYFWRLHDPTTLNRQGPDVGTQYRSAVFYFSDEQRIAAEKMKGAIQSKWENPVVTEIVPAVRFYDAEEYHQNYFGKSGGAPAACHFLRD